MKDKAQVLERIRVVNEIEGKRIMSRLCIKVMTVSVDASVTSVMSLSQPSGAGGEDNQDYLLDNDHNQERSKGMNSMKVPKYLRSLS